MPAVNLGKLVPLEVHGRVGNAKIANKYFPMSEWGVPCPLSWLTPHFKLGNTFGCRILLCMVAAT